MTMLTAAVFIIASHQPQHMGVFLAAVRIVLIITKRGRAAARTPPSATVAT